MIDILKKEEHVEELRQFTHDDWFKNNYYIFTQKDTIM